MTHLITMHIIIVSMKIYPSFSKPHHPLFISTSTTHAWNYFSQAPTFENIPIMGNSKA
jgi:hypothetical protein